VTFKHVMELQSQIYPKSDPKDGYNLDKFIFMICHDNVVSA